MSLKNSENFIVLGLFLAVLGLISAVLLAVFSDIVREPIAAAELRNTNKALEQILPPFDNQPSQDKVEIEAGGSAITFMGAVKDGRLVALAARGERKGYAGPVQALVGLDVDGKSARFSLPNRMKRRGSAQMSANANSKRRSSISSRSGRKESRRMRSSTSSTARAPQRASPGR